MQNKLPLPEQNWYFCSTDMVRDWSMAQRIKHLTKGAHLLWLAFGTEVKQSVPHHESL
jgi:hypothetical protein